MPKEKNITLGEAMREALAPLPETANTEQAQEAAALAVMVQEQQPAPVSVSDQEAAAEEAPRMDAAESLGGLLSFVPVGLSVFGWKETAEVWKPETCKGLADRVIPICAKYPWGQRFINFLETGAGVEELALVTFIIPVGLDTMKAVEKDAEARQPKPEETVDHAEARQPKPEETVDHADEWRNWNW